MKKFNADNYWFELISAPDTSGRVTRYFQVKCRCGAVARYHANGMTDDRLKKVFSRKQWHIGKKSNQHVCPDCQRKAERVVTAPGVEAAVSAAPPRSEPVLTVHSANPLDVAWMQASESERMAWLRKLMRMLDANKDHLTEEAVQMRETLLTAQQDQQQIGDESAKIVHDDDAEIVGGDNGEPADWWQDLMRGPVKVV